MRNLRHCTANRRLAAGMLSSDFKMPWQFLAGIPDPARAFGAGGVNSESNQIWWTYGESNPDFVHAMDA